MNAEKQQIAIASKLPKLFVIHKPIHDPFGYYRENGHGYTTLDQAWRVTEDVARKHITGPAYENEPDRVVMEPAPIPDYLNDLNAVHEVEKIYASTQYFYELQTVCGMPRGLVLYDIESIKHIITATAAQRAEALLRAMGLWEDEQ